jgi:hypothetical protein
VGHICLNTLVLWQMNPKIMFSDSINTGLNKVTIEFYFLSSNTLRNQINFWTSEKFAVKHWVALWEQILGWEKCLMPAVPVSREVEIRKPWLEGSQFKAISVKIVVWSQLNKQVSFGGSFLCFQLY